MIPCAVDLCCPFTLYLYLYLIVETLQYIVDIYKFFSYYSFWSTYVYLVIHSTLTGHLYRSSLSVEFKCDLFAYSCFCIQKLRKMTFLSGSFPTTAIITTHYIISHNITTYTITKFHGETLIILCRH